MTRPKDAREEWRRIVEVAGTAGVDDTADLSEEDVDRELAKAGFDVAEENRAGKAEHEAAVRAKPGVVVPLRPRPPGAWLPLAAAATVLGPVAYLAASGVGPVALVASGQDGGAAVQDAEALRSQAVDAIGEGQWGRCLLLLDVAREKDPKGDLAPGVQDLRRVAMAKLGARDAARE